MSGSKRHCYAFGPFRADPLKRLLLREGQVVPITPKAFDLLLTLLQHSGEALSKDELLQAVWPDAEVEENNLTRNISTLRKALGEQPDEHRYVVTIPGRGYSFVAPVSEESADDAVSAVVPTSKLAFGLFPLSPRKVVAGLAVSAMLMLGSATFLNRTEKTRAAFQKLAVTKLTYSGNAAHPALSPDGKLVAYVVTEAGRVSLWLRHQDTGDTQQLLAPMEARHLGNLSFSPDGQHLYFLKSEGVGPLQALYRMPALGGAPVQLVADLDGYALSPDGARLAFVRNARQTGESVLLLAGADGVGARQLATRLLAEPFNHPAWSPDGSALALSVGSLEVSGARMYPITVRVADGATNEVTSHRWALLGQLAWLADGSGLIGSGSVEGLNVSRLWRISFPSGEVRALTDEASNYGTLHLAADSLVATRTELQSNIWTTTIERDPASAASSASQITTGAGNHLVYGWMTDGRILFTSSAARPLGKDVWMMNADGTKRRQLTGSGYNEYPVVTPDGSQILFSSDRAGRLNLWSMDADGANLRQLTHGGADKFPAISPDGKWLVYTAADEGTLWKLPLEGGEAQRLTNGYWKVTAISPDGKWVAGLYCPPEPGAQFRIGLIPITGGSPARMFDFPSDLRPQWLLRWTPDGQSLIYAGQCAGHWNLWRQPLQGGEPTPLTDFKTSEQIFSFALSPDGKQLVFSRGAWVSDVALLRDPGDT
jgi:Tol biopolymer transport system component/DNA-binding winged helix-turn-helix (wHTH) protein